MAGGVCLLAAVAGSTKGCGGEGDKAVRPHCTASLCLRIVLSFCHFASMGAGFCTFRFCVKSEISMSMRGRELGADRDGAGARLKLGRHLTKEKKKSKWACVCLLLFSICRV